MTAVGVHSWYGQLSSSFINHHHYDEYSPLLNMLAKLSDFSRVSNVAASLLILLGLLNYFFQASMWCYYVFLICDTSYYNIVINGKLEILNFRDSPDLVVLSICAFTIVIVGMSDGLHMNVTIALAYRMKQLLNSNIHVRSLDACETMDEVTSIKTQYL